MKILYKKIFLQFVICFGISLIYGCVFFTKCSQNYGVRQYGEMENLSKLPTEIDNIHLYPYKASQEYEMFVKSKVNTLNIGDTYEKTIFELGEPTRINYTYSTSDVINLSKSHCVKPIGFSVIYVFEQNKENGSQQEKAMRCIVLFFDLKGRLLRIQ